MAKYSEEMVERIIDMYQTGEHTIKEICATVGIGESTFFDWKEQKSEFSESLKMAETHRYESLKSLAMGGMRKLLNGYSYDEVTEELKGVKGKEKLTETKRVKKFVMPNPTSVIFTLTNVDKKNFKHMKSMDVTTGGEKINNKIDWSKLTKKERKEALNVLKKGQRIDDSNPNTVRASNNG